jgi:sialic acid synthase SpsE
VGIAAALYAAAHGARVIEKHFTLSHSLQIDTEKAHLGAMTYNELVQIREMSLAFGKIGGV